MCTIAIRRTRVCGELNNFTFVSNTVRILKVLCPTCALGRRRRRRGRNRTVSRTPPCTHPPRVFVRPWMRSPVSGRNSVWMLNKVCYVRIVCEHISGTRRQSRSRRGKKATKTCLIYSSYTFFANVYNTLTLRVRCRWCSWNC